MSQNLLHILPETKYVPAAERLLTPKTLPIPLVEPGNLVKQISHAHTVMVVLYYYVRSRALVADPLTILLEDAIPVATFQCLFCVLCLPCAGTWNSGTDTGEPVKGATTKPWKTAVYTGTISKKRPSSGSTRKTTSPLDDFSLNWSSRISPTIFALILAVTLPPVPLATLALVLGAPLYPASLLPHTMALAVHVSLLAAMPLFYTHGVSTAAWRDISAAWLPFDEAGVWGATVGTLVGGWIGAIPMALDWDREWQKWPCTVLWGAVLGWFLGKNLTNVSRLGIGRRIDLSVTEFPAPEQAPVQQSEQKKIQ